MFQGNTQNDEIMVGSAHPMVATNDIWAGTEARPTGKFFRAENEKLGNQKIKKATQARAAVLHLLRTELGK